MPGPNSRRPCRHAVCLEPKRSGFAPLRPLTPDAEPFAAAKMRHSAMLLRNFGSPVGVGWSRCLHGRQVTAHRGVVRLSPDKTMYGVLSITFKGGIQIPRPTFFLLVCLAPAEWPRALPCWCRRRWQNGGMRNYPISHSCPTMPNLGVQGNGS